MNMARHTQSVQNRKFVIIFAIYLEKCRNFFFFFEKKKKKKKWGGGGGGGGDSLHAKLNSHYEEWSYKKKNHKKVKAYRKSV